jgi:hypothetical protein
VAEASFLDRIKDEVLVPVFATNKACKTCIFAHGEAPWADSPLKNYCMMYEREDGQGKPDDVSYEGADCEYYEAET